MYWIALGVLLLDDGFALVTPTDACADVTAHIAEALTSVLLPLM